MTAPDTDILSRLIVDHVSDGIILSDARGLVIWVNPAFSKMSGYDLVDLQGKRPADVLLGPETSPDSRSALETAIATRTSCRVDVLNYKKSGGTYLSEVNLSPIHAEDGTLTHFVSVQRDVTQERAHAQDSVDFKAYQRALEMQAIVSVADARGRITYVNDRFCDQTGYSKCDLIGRSHRMFNSGYHEQAFFKEMWATIRSGEIWHGELCNKTRAGDRIWLDTTIVPIQDAEGAIERYVSIRYDITERKQAELELIRQAETDALTGLANRVRFAMDLKARLPHEIGNDDRMTGLVVMIDLDHFKDLNDSLGHHAGDLLLKQTASRLVEHVGPKGVVARLGGDEFAAIMPSEIAKDGKAFIQDLHSKLCEPVSLDGVIYMPSFSVGVAEYPQDARTAEGLMINADTALYEAKRDGRKTWRFYDPQVRQRLDYRNHLKSVVEAALERDGFDIVLQPICSARTREHTGFEVLARLSHEGKPVPPDQFIPVAEEYGMIPAIGMQIFSKALAACRRLKSEGYDPGTFALNVAAPQFREPGFVEDVQDLLFQYGMHASEISIEITETALIGRSTDLVADCLRQFRALGMGVALDDFGTGFSSLAHLRDFTIDKIKIDKSFVGGLESAPADRSLVKGLVELACSLGIEVVAEGVETAGQAGLLRDLGCHYIQGYLHSPPLSEPEATDFLRRTIDFTDRYGT